MQFGKARGWRCTALSPRWKSAIYGVLVGAGLSLALIAAPLWMLGGNRHDQAPSAAPLAALATLPAEPAQFDISELLVGEWVGEVCPDEGDPVAARFEFDHDTNDAVTYTLLLGGDLHSAGVLQNGACDVDGEQVSFHVFLAILGDCDQACGVDRLYEARFVDGGLVGSYSDDVADIDCASCVGGGTWWIQPEA